MPSASHFNEIAADFQTGDNPDGALFKVLT